MSLINERLQVQMARAQNAAKELEQALNELSSSSLMDKLQAEIRVTEFTKEPHCGSPRRSFSVMVGGSVQWCIKG